MLIVANTDRHVFHNVPLTKRAPAHGSFSTSAPATWATSALRRRPGRQSRLYPRL